MAIFGSRTPLNLYDGLSALMSGGMIIRPADRAAVSVLDTVQLFRPDFMAMAPSMVHELVKQLDAQPFFFPKAQRIRTSGAYCSPTLQKAALDRICDELVMTYGSVETGFLAWGYSRDTQNIEGMVGQLLDDVELATVDDDGQILPIGRTGAIWVKVPDEALGTYIASEGPAPEALRNGWFRTGDIGRVDENRNLIIRGRATNVINVGGGKVSPEVLEDHIRTMPGVLDVGVAGVAVPEGYEKVCAALVGDGRPSVEMVSAHLIQRREFSRVHMVKYVAAIPRTQNGKIDRVALKRLCAD